MVNTFNHNLPFFANVAPNHGFGETLMLLVGEATKTNTPNHVLLGIEHG